MEKEEETTRELLLPNWQGSGSHGLTIAQRDDGVFVQEVMQNSPAARTGVVKEGDQIVGATIYFDNLQSGEVTQLLNTMGHHTVGLKLHRKGDRSPEPGQTWTHEVFSSRSSEVVLSTAQPSALDCNDQNKPKEAINKAGAAPISTPDAAPWNQPSFSLKSKGGEVPVFPKAALDRFREQLLSAAGEGAGLHPRLRHPVFQLVLKRQL
ncbi:neuroblast differentiation-associated protein AHNAK isoform X3 [Psammomys obesus]|uniref:neuroblast differentiation-associated protein AHNAK isoform X3 n=1 Tax=Psammomys obesus TaxID=48139 RepID=UPI002452F8A5|nr:neuroblast differentiation-associated protein AHNAK isoform X3 [Psammomys obesus]